MAGSCERRFLGLPAVRPCEGVSPAALLRDLAALARDIQTCHRSASFPNQRRCVREAAREAGALLEFFDALSSRGGAAALLLLPDSAILGLSELHVALQKLRHLLCDCGSRGARVWVLMRSGRVSDEFRILLRSVATGLEVLPLAAVDAPGEVKEVVRLVAEQARRVPVGVDPADSAAARDVHEILGQFEKGVAPDRGRLGDVLRRLQIRTWTECDEEIVFLEGELGAAMSSSGGMEDVTLLSSLRALMNYSRSVIFDVLDGRRGSGVDSKCKLEGGAVVEHLNIAEFRCPISLELMADPVTVATGHTYDRASILRWLDSGNVTCPVTGETLPNNNLVPNCALRKLIQLFCHKHNIPIAEPCNKDRHSSFSKSLHPSSSAAAGATRMLCDVLVDTLSSTWPADESKSIYEVRLLAKSSIFDKACLVEAGAVPWLLCRLLSRDSHTQADAMAAILSLSKHPKGKKSVFDSGGLGPIIEVVWNGVKAEAQQNAAATVFYLSSVEEYRIEIGKTTGAIPALVALLQQESIRGKKNAAVALLGLLLFHGNHIRVLAAGAVSKLINLLSSDREDLVGDCIAALAALAESPEGTFAILQYAAVPALVNILRSPSTLVGKEYCVSVLLHLCNNGGARVVNLLDSMPSLMPALYLVLAEGCPRAAKKASSLLSILHRDQGIPDIPSALVQQEHLGPVQ